MLFSENNSSIIFKRRHLNFKECVQLIKISQHKNKTFFIFSLREKNRSDITLITLTHVENSSSFVSLFTFCHSLILRNWYEDHAFFQITAYFLLNVLPIALIVLLQGLIICMHCCPYTLVFYKHLRTFLNRLNMMLGIRHSLM